jgi:hypothetical protein
MSDLPPLIHVRSAPRPSVPPSSGKGSVPPPPSADDAQTLPRDVLRARLQSGELPRDTEVLFAGLGDWTPASDVAALWTAPSESPNANAAPHSDRDGSPFGEGRVPSVRPVENKRSGSLGPAFAMAGAAVVLLALGAVAAYFAYFHYKPVAVTHLPAKCAVAVRIDLVDWAFFKPFSERVMPAFDEARKPVGAPPPTAAPGAPGLKERIKSNTGVDLDRDVREIAMCVFEDGKAPSGDPTHGWRAVVAIGGRMRKQMLPALFEAMRPEPWFSSLALEGAGPTSLVRVRGTSFVAGQADDGTLLLTVGEPLLTESREARGEAEAAATTGLVRKGALEISAAHLVFGLLALAPPPGLDPEVGEGLRRIDSGHFSLELGRSPKIVATFEAKKELDAQGVEHSLRALVEYGRGALGKVRFDWAGEHAALAGARVSRTDTTIELRLDFAYDDVDRGATELAKQLRDPASDLRTKTLPSAMVGLGLAPAPPSSASAAPSASSSGRAPPTTPPSAHGHGGEDDDE